MNIIQFLYSIPDVCSLAYRVKDCTYAGATGPTAIANNINYWVERYTPVRVLDVIIGGLPCCGAGIDKAGLPVCKQRCAEVYARRPALDGLVITKEYVPVCKAHGSLGQSVGGLVTVGVRGGEPTQFGGLLTWVD